MTRPAHPLIGLAQVCLAGVLWGTGGLAVQVIRRHADLSPLTISGYRTVLAALALVVVVLVLRRGASVRLLLRRHRWRTVVTGLLTAAYQALYFAAVVAVGVTVATVVSLGLAPVLLTLAAARRRRSRPTGAESTIVLAALAGLVLVSLSAGSVVTGPHPVLGVLAALASGTAYATATTVGERLARDADPLALTAATTGVGAIGIGAVALLAAAASGSPVATSDPIALLMLGYLGVVSMALAYGLFYAGLRTTPSSAASVATLLEPLTAAVVAALFLGERLGRLGVVGGVLILAAVASLGRRPGQAGSGNGFQAEE